MVEVVCYRYIPLLWFHYESEQIYSPELSHHLSSRLFNNCSLLQLTPVMFILHVTILRNMKAHNLISPINTYCRSLCLQSHQRLINHIRCDYPNHKSNLPDTETHTTPNHFTLITHSFLSLPILLPLSSCT